VKKKEMCITITAATIRHAEVEYCGSFAVQLLEASQ
jgi:hypothetical protein